MDKNNKYSLRIKSKDHEKLRWLKYKLNKSYIDIVSEGINYMYTKEKGKKHL